jgi:hypothetical protein
VDIVYLVVLAALVASSFGYIALCAALEERSR